MIYFVPISLKESGWGQLKSRPALKTVFVETQNVKIGVILSDWGHSRSSAMSPFDTALTISYSPFIKTTRLSCTVFEIQRVIYWSKVVNFSYATCICCPVRGDPVECYQDLWQGNISGSGKPESRGLSCGVVFVILRLAVLVELRLVTDG